MVSATQQATEGRLQKLAAANQEDERQRLAEKARQVGKKLIGILDYYVPEELVMAAGMVPFRVNGTWDSDVSRATVYRPVNSDLFCTHVLESVLSGKLDYLDGIITTDWDDDMRRLWDVFQHVAKPAFRPMVHVPRNDTELAYRFYAEDLASLARQLEELSGTKITPDSLRQAIAHTNRTRALLRQLYQLRRREQPPVSGAEVLGLVTAAQVMPKEEFNRELEALLAYLETRPAPLKKLSPRLLVASDHLDNPGYIQLIEDAGALVAMDDMDTGVRYFWNDVDNEPDLIYALAKRSIRKPCCPRMFFWHEHLDQVIKWVREFNIKAVVNFAQTWGPDRLMNAPYHRDRLTEAGIPSIMLTRDYHLSNVGALRTRVEAFIETLES